jgi:hypothetical protein
MFQRRGEYPYTCARIYGARLLFDLLVHRMRAARPQFEIAAAGLGGADLARVVSALNRCADRGAVNRAGREVATLLVYSLEHKLTHLLAEPAEGTGVRGPDGLEIRVWGAL